MKTLLFFFILLLVISCSTDSSEQKIVTSIEIINTDTLTSSRVIPSDTMKQGKIRTIKKATKKIAPVNKVKNKYPKTKFYTNTGEADSSYLALDWALTFFTENGDFEKLKEFKSYGFPMEWWASGMCSFYPIPNDSITFFLEKARTNGYKDYGFDCEKIVGQDIDAALSNTLTIEFNALEDIDYIEKKYQLEFKLKIQSQQYMFRTINLNAKELIKTAEKLNQDERIKKASFNFRRCD